MTATSRHLERGTVARMRAPRGVSMIYIVLAFATLCGLCSLAVDVGRAQLIKTELRKCADATAHDYIQLYSTGGIAYANTNGPSTYSAASNPVDSGSGVSPTVSVQWGYWDTVNKVFSVAPNGGPVAVKVIASRTSANGNAIPLYFASILGKRSIDLSATTIAALVTGQSASVNVPATANPYFAGMPMSTNNIYGDTMYTNGPVQVTAIPVTPGTYLTFTNFTGTSSVVPGTMPYAGPGGVSGYPYGTATHHGENWDGTGSGYTENGIADAIMPESSLMGVFLGSTAPNTNTPPATIDWTQAGVKNQPTYNNIQLQQPFYIGTGMTSGSVVQKFLVPPGATRFYVGVWDGLEYNNNGGAFAGTITIAQNVQFVQ